MSDPELIALQAERDGYRQSSELRLRELLLRDQQIVTLRTELIAKTLECATYQAALSAYRNGEKTNEHT